VLSGNWISSGWTSGIAGGTLTQPNPQITGTAPGFVDFASADYHITATSPARNAAGALEAGAPTIDRQYVTHQSSEARVAESTPDIGAFEYRGSAPPPDAAVVIPVDAGAPDAPVASPDTARASDTGLADRAPTPDTRPADTATAPGRDAGTVSRDGAMMDASLVPDSAPPLRDALAQDRVDAVVFANDSGAFDSRSPDRPSAVDAALLSGKDAGPVRSDAHADAAPAAASSSGCAIAHTRSSGVLWLALGALLFVRRRRRR
jgi:hypothetical protein